MTRIVRSATGVYHCECRCCSTCTPCTHKCIRLSVLVTITAHQDSIEMHSTGTIERMHSDELCRVVECDRNCRHTFEDHSWTLESFAPCSCSKESTRAPAALTLAHSSARMGVWSHERSFAISSCPLRSARTALESPTLATISCVPLIRASIAVVPDIVSSISDNRSSSLVLVHTLRAATSGDGLKLGSNARPLDICMLQAGHKCCR